MIGPDFVTTYDIVMLLGLGLFCVVAGRISREPVRRLAPERTGSIRCKNCRGAIADEGWLYCPTCRDRLALANRPVAPDQTRLGAE